MARATVLQWMVARALCEGAPANKGRVAALMGVADSALLARADAEGWRCIDGSPATLQALQREIVAASAAGPDRCSDAEPAGAAGGGDRHGGDGPFDGIERPGDVEGADGTDRADVIGPVGRVPDGADPVALLAAASAFVSRQVAALIERAERAEGRLDKAQIDGLSAFARMMEQWETLARERAKEDDDTSAADLADLRRRFNERIVELAALEARRLVAAGYRPGQDD